MAYTVDFEKQRLSDLKEKRSIRLIIYSELPNNWEPRKKLSISKKITSSFKTIHRKIFLSNLIKDMSASAKKINKLEPDFRDTVRIFDEMSEIRHIGDLVREACVQTEVKIEDVNRVLGMFIVAAENTKERPIKKQESKNRITLKGEFDLHIGTILVGEGVPRRKASKIIAMIRMAHPFIVPYPYRGNPTIVIDLKKETRAIEQRLRDNGL